MDAAELWAMAGAGPQAVDVVQTYDDYPVISMLQFEDLGFCGPGDGPAFVRGHDFGPGGDIAHNTSRRAAVGRARRAAPAASWG